LVLMGLPKSVPALEEHRVNAVALNEARGAAI
jgi:hypothetical protein